MRSPSCWLQYRIPACQRGLRMGIQPSFLRKRRFRENVDDLVRIVDPHKRRAGLAARHSVRLAAQATGSDPVGGGLANPSPAGGLPLLKLFRGATARARPLAARRRTLPHRDRLVSHRFEPGQYRFLLGRFSASEEHFAHCPEDSFGCVPTSSAVTQPGAWSLWRDMV